VGTDLIHQWWESDLPVAERVVRAVDLICMERMSRAQAAEVVGIKKDTLSKYLRKWGIDEWVPTKNQRDQRENEEKAQRAIDLIRGGFSPGDACRTVGIAQTTFYNNVQKLGLSDALPRRPGPRKQPGAKVKAAPPSRKTPSNLSWFLQDAKAMLWRGATAAAVAEALGITVEALQQGLEKNNTHCRTEGRCLWCEILLAHAETHENGICGDCTEMLRAAPLRGRPVPNLLLEEVHDG